MDIVINTIPLLSPLTGIGNCILHTARALTETDENHRYTYYYSYFSKKLMVPPAPGSDEDAESRFNFLHGVKRFLDRHHGVRSCARKCAGAWHRAMGLSRRFDLYYEPNYIPLDLRAGRTVVTVHDLSFHVHPEWHPADRIDYFSKRFFQRIGRADVVTVDSEFTRDELLEAASLDPARVRVVRLGVDHDLFRPQDPDEIARFRETFSLPEHFILFVGSIEPRKNLDRLLDGYASLPDDMKRAFPLVLAGFSGWHNESTMRRIAGMKGHVTFLGYLDARDLARCYAAATVFAYPSLYEGFGLPPLEAMACGCPVLASDIPPLGELCGNSAVYVGATSSESIAEGLRNLLGDHDLRSSLSARGLARARDFTWRRTARELTEIFGECSLRG